MFRYFKKVPFYKKSNLVQQTQTNGLQQVSLAVHKQAFYSIAKIIAALTVQSQKEGQAVIQQFINDIKVSSKAHWTFV